MAEITSHYEEPPQTQHSEHGHDALQPAEQLSMNGAILRILAHAQQLLDASSSQQSLRKIVMSLGAIFHADFDIGPVEEDEEATPLPVRKRQVSRRLWKLQKEYRARQEEEEQQTAQQFRTLSDAQAEFVAHQKELYLEQDQLNVKKKKDQQTRDRLQEIEAELQQNRDKLEQANQLVAAAKLAQQDQRDAARKAALLQRWEKAMADQGLSMTAQKPTEDDKSERLEAWVQQTQAELAAVKGQSADATKAPEKKPEPYRLRENPELLTRVVFQTLVEISKHWKRLPDQSKQAVTEAMLSIFQAGKTRRAIIEKTRSVLETCLSQTEKTAANTHLGMGQVKSQLSNLYSSLPSPEQIEGSQITSAQIQTLREALRKKLLAFGVQPEDNNKKASNIQRIAKALDRGEVVIRPSKPKPKERKAAEKRRRSRTERSHGYTEKDTPVKKTRRNNGWEQHLDE